MKLTPGKLAGLKAVSDERGVISALALDQRGALRKLLGPSATDEQLREFKCLVTEVLSEHSTAVLLDPEYGLPAGKRRARQCGMLLAYEKTGYDKSAPGRLPDTLDHWSVRRLKETGADCVKALIYYSSSTPADLNDQKQAWVERVGDECRALDIAFFLEILTYEEGTDDKELDWLRRKPQCIAEATHEFCKSRYGVDALKVEVPVNLKYVEGTRAFLGQKVFTLAEAIWHLHHCAAAASLPFVYLSAGVSNQEFTESLELAAEAGARYSGVLCGRASWKDGVDVYAQSGAEALVNWLRTDGASNVKNVSRALERACSWRLIYTP